MKPSRILVVDDDDALRHLIGDFLRSNAMDVTLARNAAEMDRHLTDGAFDLIVLDLMMPGEDGLSVIRRMRGDARPPIIVLSAMGDDTDRIIGLEVGADDYLAKPCNPRELLARIRARLRRGTGNWGPTRAFGPWTLDIVERSVRRDGGAPVMLTGAEFRILTAFLDRPQRILERDTLINIAKGEDAEVYDRAIDVTISRLRKKLGQNAPIHTVRGEGYMFRLDGQP